MANCGISTVNGNNVRIEFDSDGIVTDVAATGVTFDPTIDSPQSIAQAIANHAGPIVRQRIRG